MRVLFRLLAARSGAGVAGSELLQRCEWPRGVVLGLSRERGHGAALAAAGGAAPIVGEAQQQLQAVQRNASYLSRAARRLAGLCEDAGPRARSAQSARLPAAESVWLAISAKAFPAFWATPNCAQCDCCAGGRPRCGDAERRARGGRLQWRGRWSTPRRARTAGAAQRSKGMGGRFVALRRPTLTIDYRRLL